jgi:hypothetical protein
MARFKSSKPQASKLSKITTALGSLLKFTLVLGFFFYLLILLSPSSELDVADSAEGLHPELQHVIALREAEQDEQALALIAQMLTQSEDNRPLIFSANDQCWLYQQQTDIYLERGHRHLALASLDQCLGLAIDSERKPSLIKHRDSIQQHIDANQIERNEYQSYVNLQQSGYAKQLQGNVVLIYVYLEDNLWQGWSGTQRFMMREHIEQVGQWYQQQAQLYQQAKPSFEFHYYHVQTGRGISAEWLRSVDFFDDAAPLLLEQMGYNSWQQMHDLMTDFGKKQLAVIFHSNQDHRSFARSCPKRAEDCAIEYVMLTESSLDPQRWVVPQVQAHEMAHLFGAADLYNIQHAKDYATTDLMNYYSSQLKHAEISPITAWALGWAPKPAAPFELEE